MLKGLSSRVGQQKGTIIAAAVGLVAGIVIGQMTGGGGAVAEGEHATADARAACDLLRRTPKIDEKTITEDDATFWRWGATWSLVSAAASGDERYRPLADAVLAAHTAQQEQATEAKEFATAVQSARDFCADDEELTGG